MGVCKFCGEKAGWFSEAHDACVAAAREGCQQIASLLASVVTDKLIPPAGCAGDDGSLSRFAAQVWSEVKPALDRVTAEHRVPSDAARQAILQGWSTGAEQVGLAQPAPFDRFAATHAFYRLVGFGDQEVRKTDGFLAIAFSTILWSVMVHGDPTSDAVADHPFNLRGGEVPLFFFGSVVYSKETVSKSYQGGYGGASVRVGRGVYYHFGGFRGQRIDTAALKEIDYGGMLLTTENIYFGGEHTNFRIPYEHVVSFRPHSDGIGIFRDAANAKAEVFSVLEAGPDGKPVSARPVFGWFLFNLAHFLAQPEGRALYGTKAHSHPGS
jgi:hypothetical protein